MIPVFMEAECFPFIRVITVNIVFNLFHGWVTVFVFLFVLSFAHDLCTNQCVLAVVQEATEPPYVTSRFMISAVSSVSGELAEVSCK